MPFDTDVLIVGAGFSGLVVAERLSAVRGLRCLIVDKRDHIGGNAADEYDAAGVLVHKYGPHYFRSNSDEIVKYLSRFTEWLPVDYQILSYTQGRYWQFPINLNTFEQLIGRSATEEEFCAWLARNRVPIARPSNSEEIIISQVGVQLYELFFRGYTLKQWQRHPRELDASVCGRIPVRTNRDNRYLSERFQALPKAGYHVLFRNLLQACAGAQVLLKADYRDVIHQVRAKHIVFTGPIDEFFNYRYGRLPYRSLRFEPRTFGPEDCLNQSLDSTGRRFWQPAMQVNYPNDHLYTRSVEIKHATQQKCDYSTVVFEYPQEHTDTTEAYYPIPSADSGQLYERYAELARNTSGVTFTGRLATYRYYNMDQVVGAALVTAGRLCEEIQVA
jgi:UDP-galactopyranose mutase